MASDRQLVVDRLRSFWSKLRNGRYYVRRGAINWAAFDFGKHRFAVAILVDDCTLFGRPFNTMTLAFEVFTVLPTSPEDMDDKVLDEFFEDVRDAVRDLQIAKNSQGDALVTKYDASAENAIESHDADKGVQGLVASVRFDF